MSAALENQVFDNRNFHYFHLPTKAINKMTSSIGLVANIYRSDQNKTSDKPTKTMPQFLLRNYSCARPYFHSVSNVNCRFMSLFGTVAFFFQFNFFFLAYHLLMW